MLERLGVDAATDAAGQVGDGAPGDLGAGDAEPLGDLVEGDEAAGLLDAGEVDAGAGGGGVDSAQGLVGEVDVEHDLACGHPGCGVVASEVEGVGEVEAAGDVDGAVDLLATGGGGGEVDGEVAGLGRDE
ncbi:hypothetical protein [Nocardioides dokdonensis]|uniref:hypothetical protein n=1 Tax=Nocardioides dokdonensis TaxID=450734 RepID=UPI0012F86404|nr:hypothetical protein [Nocardioides dokdonensis]